MVTIDALTRRLPGEHLEQLALLRDLSAADFKYLGDEQKLGK